jgi:hypothetical protein
VGVPVIHLKSQSPNHEQALAAGIFHLNRGSLAPRIFHLKRLAIIQALAPRVFHLNHHSTEQVFAPRTFCINRHILAPRIFHLKSPGNLAVSCTRPLLQQTEISFRRFAVRWLLNLAHFVLARIWDRMATLTQSVLIALRETTVADTYPTPKTGWGRVAGKPTATLFEIDCLHGR